MAGQAQRRTRIGIAGLGRMGRSHARNLAHRTPSAELVMVVDAIEQVAREVGAELGVPSSTSFDELLARADIDAVVVVAPTPLHTAMIVQAAAAGKHIFCEKPIALSQDPTRTAIRAAAAAGVKLQIGFHRRFDPDFRATDARIRAGELGEVHLFRTSLRDMRPPSIDYLKTSGGFFLDVTIHDFDTARWMVGEIDEVTAVGAAVADPAIAKIGDLDTAVITLRFASGALGVIDNSRAAGYGYEGSTEIIGSRATVRIANHRRSHVQWLTPGQVAVDHVRDFAERFAPAYADELEAFASAVRDDRPVAVTGEDALAALLLCEAASRSLRDGRTVKVPHL